MNIELPRRVPRLAHVDLQKREVGLFIFADQFRLETLVVMQDDEDLVSAFRRMRLAWLRMRMKG